jgi:hypothetical protein
MLRELAEGWSEFVSRRWLWTIVVAAGIGNMAWITGSVYGPLVARQSLGGAGPWGAIAACEAAGLLLGGVLLLRYRPRPSASRSRGRSRTRSASRTPSGWPRRSWPGPCSQPSRYET